MSRLLQNVVFAWRLVRRQPAFSAIAILTLALGIGATTALRSDVAAVDPVLPLANVKPLETLVDASIGARRFTMMLFVAFAAVAAALAAIGVYGVLAYLVSQRTKEIGLRLAIGASPSAVIWLLVREGVALTGAGLVVGLAGALAAGKWIRTLLFGVTPADPATFAGVSCVLATAAVLAIYVPARRAADADPTIALRTD